jgi:hypothetical protein
VDIPWYCWIVVGVVAGPIGLIVTGIVNGVAQHMAQNLADSALNGLLGNGLGSTTLGGLDGATFDAVQITTEGLTIEGNVPVALPAPETQSLSLVGSVVTSSTQTVSTGTYHDVSICNLGDFPYTESTQLQTGTYHVETVLMGQPLNLKWSIVANGTYYPITGASGSLAIPGMKVQYPFPLPAGTAMNQTVHVGYALSNNVLTLKNTPTEGSYVLGLKVTGTDPKGISKDDFANVQFAGDVVAIGGDYYNLLAACMQQLWAKAHQTVSSNQWPQVVPANYPEPDQVIGIMYAAASISTPEADQVLANMALQQGASYLRALASPAAAAIGLAAGTGPTTLAEVLEPEAP